jgi:hypothetical protein
MGESPLSPNCPLHPDDTGEPMSSRTVDLTGGGVFDPRRLLADRLVQRVDLLLADLPELLPHQRETMLDLLSGLSLGAEALYAAARRDADDCADHTMAASLLLAAVEADTADPADA